MASLPFPDTGTRMVILRSGKPAENATRGYLYADEDLTIPAEVYADDNGVKGALIPADDEGRVFIRLNSRGEQVDYWGPVDGTDRLWIVVGGFASKVDADYNARLDSLGGRVAAVEGGSAADTVVLHKAGAETVTGVKTFSVAPVIPTPTAGTDPTTKTYVDNALAAKVQIGGDLTGTITAPAIASGAVTSGKIADGTIVDGDISGSASITQSKISGLVAALAAIWAYIAGLVESIAAKVTKDDQVIFVKDHGVVCDGVVDDTTALNTLLTASAAGLKFLFPPGSNCKVTAPLVLAKAATIGGSGATITNTAGTETFKISAGTSGVTIRGLGLVGPGSGTVQALGHAVHAVGTLASPVTDLTLKNLTISGFGKSAFWLEGIQRFTLRGNTISDIAYAGIMVLSGQWGVITGNKVRNLVQPSGYINSYGIALSRDSSQNISLTPRTSDVLVANNLVDGVPSWEGIDSHGGERLIITGNRVYNCFIPVAMVSCNNEFGVDSYGCRDVVVSGNVIRSGVTNGSSRAGIQMIGAGSAAGSPTDYATGVISGNIIEDCGTENSSVGSGLIIRYSEGVVVTGNVLRNPSLTGILIDHTNSGFSVTGNTIVDAWTTSSSFSAGILVNSTYNVGYIGANNGVRGSKSATIVNQRGVYLNSGAATGTSITLGANDFATFSLPLVDSGNLGQNRFDGKQLGFYGVTPVTRPTSTAEIKAALAGLGLLTDGGASPLDLDGGALTAGSIKASARVATVTTSTTPTPNAGTTDLYDISALASAATFGAPTGSPTDGQRLTIRIKDDGNARALTWNSVYRAVGTVLPTTTVAGQMLYVGCLYNTAATRWDVLAIGSE